MREGRRQKGEEREIVMMTMMMTATVTRGSEKEMEMDKNREKRERIRKRGRRRGRLVSSQLQMDQLHYHDLSSQPVLSLVVHIYL